MSLQSNFTFVASASITVTPPNGPAQTYALPAVDAGNTAMTITNNSTSTAYVQLGNASSGMNAGPNQHGTMVIQSGQANLLMAGNQGSATFASVSLFVAGGSVTFTRGTATPVVSFASHDDQTVV